MPLNFDFADMIERVGRERYDELTDHPVHEGVWHPATDALIWMCMSVGMPGITEKNVDEFWSRMAALQAVTGAALTSQAGPVYLTRADVENHIGLRTNVTKMSAKKFNANLARLATEAGERSADLQGASAYEKAASV